MVLTPLVRVLALKKGFVAYPRADRWHKQATALLGGIGIYLAAVVPALFVKIPDKRILGLLIGGSFLFLVGLADDKFHLKPYTKLFCQIIAGCLAVAFGVSLALPKEPFIAIPLTLLWIVLVTNAFNLLDNIDGLAGGIAGIAGVMLFISGGGVYGLILAGAVFGFLPYNFNPAKIFMGDSGSMFLGFSLAVISILETHRQVSGLFTALFIPVLILSVPIFDTLFVSILRKLQGRSVFEGGKDHTSHHLVAIGLSQRKTVILLYAISIIFGLIAVLYSRLSVFVVSVAAFLGVGLLFYFGIYLADSMALLKKKEKEQHKPAEDVTVLAGVLLHKRRAVELLMDMGFICIAYTVSYYLRFEKGMLAGNLQLMRESLPWIVLIKMSIFFIFGLYRGAWRYVSISDMLSIFKAVTLASVGSILFLTLWFRFQEYSRAIFIIDWIILLFLVSASRISFRVLGEFLGRMGDTKGKNVLIFGAGDVGEMVVREIKRNKALNYNPVGFIDDDPKKKGSRIQGVSVLGARGRIRNLIRENDVKEIIVAIPAIDVADLSEIAKVCGEYGIAYRKVKGILDEDSQSLR